MLRPLTTTWLMPGTFPMPIIGMRSFIITIATPLAPGIRGIIMS